MSDTQTSGARHDPQRRRRDPQLGFGVFQMPPEETVEAIARAFDFELGDDEMRAIEDLDAGVRIGPHPDTFA